jgi:hypothetical protein
MSLPSRFGLIVLGAVSAAAAGSWVHAQAPLGRIPSLQPPTIISGGDLGFRVDSRKGDTPVGTLVVRVDGQWVEVEFAMGMKRLTAK